MWRPSVPILRLIPLFAVVLLGAEHRAAAQTGTPPAPADQAPARLSGMWRLNVALSSPTPPEAPIGQQGPPGQGGPPGGGGRGGRSGGFGGERRGNPTNADKAVQVRAVMREITPPALTLAIAASSTHVAFTSDDGVVRRFVTDGRKAKVDLGGANIDVTSRWEPNGIVQELAPPGLKVTRAWRVTEQGNQMVLSVTLEGGPDPHPAPLLFVYDREK